MTPVINRALCTVNFSTRCTIVHAKHHLRRKLRHLLRVNESLLGGVTSVTFPKTTQLLQSLFNPIILTLQNAKTLLHRTRQIHGRGNFNTTLHTDKRFVTRNVTSGVHLIPHVTVCILPITTLTIVIAIFRAAVHRPCTLRIRISSGAINCITGRRIFGSTLRTIRRHVGCSNARRTHFAIRPACSIAITRSIVSRGSITSTVLGASDSRVDRNATLCLSNRLATMYTSNANLRQCVDDLLRPCRGPSSPGAAINFGGSIALRGNVCFGRDFRRRTRIRRLLSNIRRTRGSCAIRGNSAV